MENFEERKKEYLKKLSTSYGRSAYDVIRNTGREKNKIKNLFFNPKNEQELRLADSVLSIVIDAVKMYSYEEIVAEDDGWDAKLLVGYLTWLMHECIAKENKTSPLPPIAAQFLYEGARAIALKKVMGVLIKLNPAKLFEFLMNFKEASFIDMATEYNHNESPEFLDYLEEVQKEFHKLFEEGYSEKRQIAETFYDRRNEYYEKTYSECGFDAENYLLEVIFTNDIKMQKMIDEPQNNQELRRVEAILLITMDYRSMMDYNDFMPENIGIDRDALAKYSMAIVDSNSEIISDIESSPKKMAHFLFAGATGLTIPSDLVPILSSSEAKQTIFNIISKASYKTLFAKSDIKFLEEVAEEFHKLFQQEYGEKGYQYKYGNSKGKK